MNNPQEPSGTQKAASRSIDEAGVKLFIELNRVAQSLLDTQTAILALLRKGQESYQQYACFIAEFEVAERQRIEDIGHAPKVSQDNDAELPSETDS